MKKTFTINISGSVFHIDEDAFEKLQSYLQMLNQHFGASEEGREILQDIEARIAELFSEKMEDGKDVINETWVEEVMARMGKPEDFMEVEDDESNYATKSAAQKIKRRMYRDPDRRMLGGVCGGMGAYFNIDPVILRIIFIVLLILTNVVMVFIYIILWIAVPKARTTAEKLEMRGEDATVSNIEKSIKEEVKEVKESYQRFKNSDTYEKGKEGMSRFGELVYNVLKVSLKVLVVLVGAFLVIFGFFSLLGFISSMIIGHSILINAPLISGWGADIGMPNFLDHFVSPGSFSLAMISIGLLVAIPLLAILFIGIKMIFRFKTNNKIIGLASVGVWLVALFTLILVSVGQVGNFSKKTATSTSTTIECQDCKQLVLELGEDKYEYYTDFDIDLNNMRMVKINDEEILVGEPKLGIEKSSGDQFAVTVKKKARGKNIDDAQENIETIEYNYYQTDSLIKFDPYYTLKEDANWRDQEVYITLRVPVGKLVYLDRSLIDIIHDIDNVDNVWDGDMVGKTWIMTHDGLELTK